MRISTIYQFTNSVSWIDNAVQNVSDAQTQVSSGKRFQTLSQDPYAATQSIRLQSILNDIKQYNSNITGVKASLTTSESALDEMNTLMKQANQLAISAANATTDQATRQNYVSQIQTIQDRLVSLGNSQGNNGQYIFAGQKNDKPPFSAANGVLTFSGDTNDTVAEVGPSATMASNTKISDLLTKVYGPLESFKTDLSSGNTSLISSQDIANTKAASDQLIQMRGDVGAKMSTLSDLASQNSSRQLDVTSNLSDNQDVDVAAAVTKLQSAQIAYQAALSVASIGFKTSLLNYIQ